MILYSGARRPDIGAAYKAATPYIYGLPKTHKPTVPLRPIIAYHLSPAYRLSKYLSTFLTPLVKNRPHSSP
ncbi:hypothetical protein LAZ67_9002975 [Cordylochernes scorpioides]|uniref:Uncharacterized protein n=1 Tax=Cordylochernes scorpioides TaxID=51811 RepID=A0ABY6KWY2_9ARAC|nr:hypothetical protein LAZ67_9002975 [Cordylochernes scorpioides]